MTEPAPPTWDLFISYATEDGEAVAYPLARLLQSLGCSVWIDRTALSLGDSLRRRIDEGLARSRFGVVILSPSFFAKRWPNHELSGLLQREVEGTDVILPIWHRLTASEVRAYSPPLADRVAANTSESLEVVAVRILEVARPDLVEATLKDSPRVEEMPPLSTGTAILGVVAGAHMFAHHHSPFDSPEEADMIADALQQISEIGEMFDDFEVGERVRSEYALEQLAQDLRSKGWELFGRQEVRKMTFAGKHVDMDVAVIVAARGPNARVAQVGDTLVIGRKKARPDGDAA